MIYRIYGQKDTTIYEQNTRKTQNTGADEILEVTKFYDELTNETFIGNSRILTQFDITSLSESISNGDISSNCKFYLNLTSTEQNEVQSQYQLDVYQVSQSWAEGIGQYYYSPIVTDGVSWEYRNDLLWPTGSFELGTTGSYTINAVVGCYTFIFGARNHGWPDGKGYSSQHHYTSGNGPGIYHIQRWPNRHDDTCGAGRA